MKNYNIYKSFRILAFSLFSCVALNTAVATQVYSIEMRDEMDAGSIVVTINPSPTFSKKDTTICSGFDINLQNLIRNLSANATVKFYKDRLAQTEISNIQSPSTATKYYMQATNNTTLCASPVDSLIVVVKDIPVIVSITPSLYVCERDPLFLEVVATGTNLSYQWMLNGKNIEGAIASTYSISSVKREDNGTYTVKVTNDCSTVTADTKVEIRWDGILVVKFFDVILVDNHEDRFVAYQWYLNGQKLTRETKHFLETKGGLNGLYKAEITLVDGTKIMTCDTLINLVQQPLIVKVYPNPVETAHEVTVRIDGLQVTKETVKVEVFNVLGQRFGTYEFSEVENKIKMNAAIGTYVFRITLPTNEIKIEKVIVK